MNRDDRHGRLAPAVANDEMAPGTPPTVTTRALLPRVVEKKFVGPRPPSPRSDGSIYNSLADEMNAAAWCALLGWAASDVVQFVADVATRNGIDLSDNGVVGPRNWELWAGDLLALGRYLVHGIEPDMTPREDQVRVVVDRRTGESRRIWFSSLAQQAARGEWCTPTGPPRLSVDDLSDYLDDVYSAALPMLVGRTRHSDRAVLAACLTIAREAGTVVPALSVRTIARRANVSEKTVTGSLKRLRAYEILRLFGTPGAGQAQQYIVSAPDSRTYHTSSDQNRSLSCWTDEMCGSSGSPLDHPAFHGMSGKVRHSLLSVLAVGSQPTVKSWFYEAGVSESSFHRHRKLLAGEVDGVPSAVEWGPDGWCLVEPARLAEALDAIAEHEGATDKVNARDARLRREQEQHKAWLLRHVSDTHVPHGLGHAVDLRTGEIVPLADVVSANGRPLIVEVHASEEAAEEPSQMPPHDGGHGTPDTVAGLTSESQIDLSETFPFLVSAQQSTDEPVDLQRSADEPMRCPLLPHRTTPPHEDRCVAVHARRCWTDSTGPALLHGAPSGLCVACGLPCRPHHATGLRLHRYCRVPHWMAPSYERRGQPIPPHQILAKPAPPPGFDPYEIDPVERPEPVHLPLAVHAA